MQELEKKSRIGYLTTGQVIGITRVGYSSLYTYVRNFGKFFSPGVNKHTRGRSWSPDDLALVESIRCLRHERKTTEEIHESLAAGWRVDNNPAWSREERARLVEVIGLMVEEFGQYMREAAKELKESQQKSRLTLEDHNEVAKIGERLEQIDLELEILERHWKVKDWVLHEMARDTREVKHERKKHFLGI